MSTTTKHVQDMFASRNEDAADMFDAYVTDREYEGQDAADALSELPLSVERKVLVTITLGTGGPSDWIECTCSARGGALELERAVYVAQWGSDRVATTLERSDALYRFAAFHIDTLEAN